jgi:hypothetical protein
MGQQHWHGWKSDGTLCPPSWLDAPVPLVTPLSSLLRLPHVGPWIWTSLRRLLKRSAANRLVWQNDPGLHGDIHVPCKLCHVICQARLASLETPAIPVLSSRYSAIDWAKYDVPRACAKIEINDCRSTHIRAMRPVLSRATPLYDVLLQVSSDCPTPFGVTDILGCLPRIFTIVSPVSRAAHDLVNASCLNVANLSHAPAAFPLFGVQMYEKLGYQWATALLAFLTLAMLPFPYLFFRYGKKIRAKSRFATST